MDNPFRPEGELAREATEFVNELKLKAERDINELIHNTTASTISQSALSHTVNEILSEPKELRTSPPVSPAKSPLKEARLNGDATPLGADRVELSVEAKSSEPATKTPITGPTTATGTADAKAKKSKKSVNKDNKPSADKEEKTSPSKVKKSADKEEKTAPSKDKKTKAKCGCVLS